MNLFSGLKNEPLLYDKGGNNLQIVIDSGPQRLLLLTPKKELANRLEKVVIPWKGRLCAMYKEIENFEDFKETKRKRLAAESAINALGNHGLDRCPDHGFNGFKRYAALAGMARNLKILGYMLQQKELKRLSCQSNIEQKAASSIDFSGFERELRSKAGNYSIRWRR